MHLVLEHRTAYVFSRPVFLEPHVIRLAPRPDPAQRVLDFRLDLDPAPAGRWDGLDAEGNHAVQVWFDGLHSELGIRTRLEVETRRDNPFAFLPVAAGAVLPPELTPAHALALSPCLRRIPGLGGAADAPAALAAELARGVAAVEGGTLEFLLALNARLHGSLARLVRREPGLQTPAETLEQGRGACRDLAVLFMDVCRCAGVPARFVSGYHLGAAGTEADERDLHAWAEAWVPGAGWLGFDPTQGLLAAAQHVALAASHDPALAAPLSGSFRGTGALARLEHEIIVYPAG
ncbi:MAG: transglutaminase N-terminal domain-containing protein [Desulfovibrionaceae bacterium]